MTAENSETGSTIPLDYGRKSYGPRGWWARLTGWFQERFEFWWESVGYCLGMGLFLAGGPRQLVVAFGMAFLAGGLGLAIEGESFSSGHFWMWVGGFMVGLIVPIPKTSAEKERK
jgi:hypothetical protein